MSSGMMSLIGVFIGTTGVCVLSAWLFLRLDPLRWRVFQLIEFVFLVLAVLLAHAQLERSQALEREERAVGRVQLALSRLSLGITQRINKMSCFEPSKSIPDKCNDFENLRRRLLYEWPAVRFLIFTREEEGPYSREQEYVKIMWDNLREFVYGYGQAGFRPMQSMQADLEQAVRGSISELRKSRAALADNGLLQRIGSHWFLFLASAAAIRLSILVKDILIEVEKRRAGKATLEVQAVEAHPEFLPKVDESEPTVAEREAQQ